MHFCLNKLGINQKPHLVIQVEHNLDLLGTLGTLLAPGGKLSIAEVKRMFIIDKY